MIGKYPTYVEMANAIRAAVSALSGGLPAGGSTGEVLTKASATDYDATWQAAPASPNGLPTGGTANQLLVKNSATNYDASFATVGTVPTGGTFAQSLVKQSATDYDVVWGNPTAPNGLPTGGTANQVLAKIDGTNYNTQWVTPSSGGPVQAIKGTAAGNTTSTAATAATAIPGLTWSVTSGTMYHFKARGTYQTAATTTGLRLGFSTTVATTYCAWDVTIQQAAAGTDQMYTATATALTTTVASASVVAANTDYIFELEGYVQPSANGTIAVGFGTEVAGSTATIRPGCVLIVTTCT